MALRTLRGQPEIGAGQRSALALEGDDGRVGHVVRRVTRAAVVDGCVGELEGVPGVLVEERLLVEVQEIEARSEVVLMAVRARVGNEGRMVAATLGDARGHGFVAHQGSAPGRSHGARGRDRTHSRGALPARRGARRADRATGAARRWKAAPPPAIPRGPRPAAPPGPSSRSAEAGVHLDPALPQKGRRKLASREDEDLLVVEGVIPPGLDAGQPDPLGLDA